MLSNTVKSPQKEIINKRDWSVNSLCLLFVAQRIDAFPQDKKWRVDVASFLQSLSFILRLRTALRAGEVTQTQPSGRLTVHLTLFLTDNIVHFPAVTIAQLYSYRHKKPIFTHSLTVLTRGIPASSILKIRMEKILWLNKENENL